MAISFETVLLDEKESRVLVRTYESCLRFRPLVWGDAVVRVSVFGLGHKGQLPRNGDARCWTHDVCRAERQNIAFVGAVDNLLKIVVDFFKDSAVDEPRFAVGCRISFFSFSCQRTIET